ncbi:hypothetical protein LTR95_019316, partial [Oleoguttula sp. CCFEE 5521]
ISTSSSTALRSRACFALSRVALSPSARLCRRRTRSTIGRFFFALTRTLRSTRRTGWVTSRWTRARSRPRMLHSSRRCMRT